MTLCFAQVHSHATSLAFFTENHITTKPLIVTLVLPLHRTMSYFPDMAGTTDR